MASADGTAPIADNVWPPRPASGEQDHRTATWPPPDARPGPVPTIGGGDREDRNAWPLPPAALGQPGGAGGRPRAGFVAGPAPAAPSGLLVWSLLAAVSLLVLILAFRAWSPPVVAPVDETPPPTTTIITDGSGSSVVIVTPRGFQIRGSLVGPEPVDERGGVRRVGPR